MMLSEPFNTLLFLIVIPGLVQLIKILKEKQGAEFGKVATQVLALIVSAVFMFISGGLAGVPLPVLPGLDFGADFVGALGMLINFVAELATYLVAVWALIMGLYDAILERLFLLVGFVTQGAKMRAEMRKAK